MTHSRACHRQKALPPAESAGDATRNMLEARALSNKINYSALADLFADPAAEVCVCCGVMSV